MPPPAALSPAKRAADEPLRPFPRSPKTTDPRTAENRMSDRFGRALVAVALVAIALTLTIGSVRLLMTLEALR